MCNVNCTTIKTKRQSNLGLLPKGGSHLFTLSFSNFKMSYLIQYLSYVHTVFGFQLLLTHSVLNSRKIKTIPNFNLKKIWHHKLWRHIVTSSTNKSFKMIDMLSYINLPGFASRRSTSTKLWKSHQKPRFRWNIGGGLAPTVTQYSFHVIRFIFKINILNNFALRNNKHPHKDIPVLSRFHLSNRTQTLHHDIFKTD